MNLATLKEITVCEVCNNKHLQPVLNLGLHPLCDDLIPVESPERNEEFPIEILYCAECSTAHQRFQVQKERLFPSSYHYRARHTLDVLNGMEELAASVEQTVGGLKGKVVLDIGCNDGSLLSCFARRGASTTGIEPTGAADDAIAAGHDVLIDYFTPEVAQSYLRAHRQPDIITFTNVFAHIEDLNSVVEGLRLLMSDNTSLVIENHYLGSILDTDQFDTFYHEHPRTYSLRSFARIAESLDAKIESVTFPKRYGGNIRVQLSKSAPATETLEPIASRELDFGSGLRRLDRRVQVWRDRKGELLRKTANRYGPLLAKAFPGRAAIAAKLLDLDGTVSAVFEKDTSAKIGNYVPGTRIPILPDATFFDHASDGPLINMAWHIAPEIHTYMRSRGFAGDIIDIIAPADFET